MDFKMQAQTQGLKRAQAQIQMRTIDSELRIMMTDRIVQGIERILFGESQGGIRILRIRQSILHATLCLLGKQIRSDRIDDYIFGYIGAHVRATVPIGEAVGIISAQSLNQPVTQAVLKSQHRTGNKESSGANSLIALNMLKVSTRTFKIHLLGEQVQNQESMRKPSGLRYLSTRFEEVKMEDILVSTFGDAKYTAVPAPDGYDQDPLFTYISRHDTYPGEILYRFRMDPSKLDDAGITQFNVYDLLLKLDTMVAIHPMSTFQFDLIPGSKPLTYFLDMIKRLMNQTLKGIPGLVSISDRSVSVDQLVKHVYYDQGKDETYLYLNPSAMMHFPVSKLIESIGIEPLREVTRPEHTTLEEAELLHLVYPGKLDISSFPSSRYTYYLFMGPLTLKELMSSDHELAGMIDKRYLISNDPHEMITMVGKTGARIVHEFNYSEELTASETPLHYQHITNLCRRMFGYRLNPITPSSYMKDRGTNALDKLCHQNYRQNLEREIVKGDKSGTHSLPSAVLVGKRPRLGTGYIELEVDNERKQEVIDLYSRARQEQLYLGSYPGVEFPKLGEIKPLTSLSLKPFGNAGLPNRDIRGL